MSLLTPISGKVGQIKPLAGSLLLEKGFIVRYLWPCYLSLLLSRYKVPSDHPEQSLTAFVYAELNSVICSFLSPTSKTNTFILSMQPVFSSSKEIKNGG